MPSVFTWAESYSGQTDERVKITVNFSVSQNASANTSTITIDSITCYYNYDYYAGKSFYIDGIITVDDKQIFYSNYKTPQATVSAGSKETHTISGGTRNSATITHGSDGTKTVTFKFAAVNTSNVSGFAGINGNYESYQFFVRDSEDKTKTYTLPTIDQWPGYSWYNLGYNDGTGDASVTFNLTKNQVGYYWYQPPSDGTITIYSTGSTDTYGGFGTGMSLSSTQTSGGDIVTGESYSCQNDIDGSSNRNFICTDIPVTGGDWAGQVFVHGYNNAASGTLYIDFTPSNYTITYDANGGSGTTDSQTVTAGESIALRANGFTTPTTAVWGITLNLDGGTGGNATLNSQTFYRWKIGSSYYKAGDSYTPSGNTTVYATWNSNYKLGTPSKADTTTTGYTVTFNYQGATGGNSTNSTVSTLRTSYNFAGWKSGSGTIYSADSIVGGPAQYTYTAQWNSSTSSDAITLPTPTKTNYIFAGWATDSNATSGIINSYTPTANTTLYAIWTLNTFNVVLAAKTGIDSVSGGGSKTVGDSVTINATLKTGYRWTGWFNSGTTTMVSDAQSYTFTMPANNVSYDAFGHKNTYKVAYEANGGSGTMTTSTFYYDTDETLKINTFTRLGYAFQGWATSLANAEAGTVTYADGATVNSLTSVQDEIIILYAVWKPVTNMFIYTRDKDGNMNWVPALKYVYTTK